MEMHYDSLLTFAHKEKFYVIPKDSYADRGL
jgi:hypothetical protein